MLDSIALTYRNRSDSFKQNAILPRHWERGGAALTAAVVPPHPVAPWPPCGEAGMRGTGSGAPRPWSRAKLPGGQPIRLRRSEEHTSEIQSLMRLSYAVFCMKNKKYD